MRNRVLIVAALSWLGCKSSSTPPPAPDARPAEVFLSEIMYHPVLEDNPVEDHEFVELFNRGAKPVDLAGWRITGLRFVFPMGASIGAGQRLVVAKNKTRLLAVPAYKLQPAQVVGDYPGKLSNDGEKVELIDAQGRTVDQVRYHDSFPWPLGADALGVGDDWLPPEMLPLEKHRFMGRSLERLSFDVPGSVVANWIASPLDGATPGRDNSTATAPPAIVEALEISVEGRKGALIRSTEPVLVTVRFSEQGTVSSPELEYFVDDQERDDEPVTRLPLAATGVNATATLPIQKDNSVVRYRVVGDRGKGREVISPRPSDPYLWHSYFVSPVLEGKTPPFRLFIAKRRWEELWDNIEAGRVPGNSAGGTGTCAPNPRWDDTVAATLVIEGKVYDIRVRHQGSRSNRTNGPNNIDMMKWPKEVMPPARPVPFKPLSWHFKFPRYARFEDKRVVNVTKLRDQACQGLYAIVGNTLFQQAGVPAGEQKHFVRMFVNGAYYHYMQRFERIDEDMLTRFYGADHVVGDLWKSVGARWDEGPYGWGDERLLEDWCGYSAAERYDWTYKRITLKDWKTGSADVKTLIENLHAARAGGPAALRTFFEKTFDMNAMLNYMAVLNWMSPWDDAFQNHFLYRQADGRWLMIPTDMDNLFGSNPPSAADGSFFDGVENARANRNNLMNFIKDSFLRTFRQEFIQRLKDLSQDVLHPNNVAALVDEALTRYDVEEAKLAPAGIITVPMCGGGDPVVTATRMKNFARVRWERIQDGLFD